MAKTVKKNTPAAGALALIRDHAVEEVKKSYAGGSKDDFEKANDTIKAIADKHGEKMVPMVLEELGSEAVANLLAEVAAKQTSLIGDLIAPATFAEAFVQLPKRWGWNDQKLAIGDVHTIITDIVMQLNDDYKYFRASKLYEALDEKSIALRNSAILAWWLMEYSSDVVYFARKRKWLSNLDDFAFKEQRSEVSGQLDYSLLSSVNFDDDGEAIDVPEGEEAEFVVDADEQSEVIYCICPDKIRKCVEKMPKDLLEKVVGHLNYWASKKWSSAKVFTKLLPRVQKSKPIGTAKKATVQSAL